MQFHSLLTLNLHCWQGQHSSLLPALSLLAVWEVSWLPSEPGKEADPAESELEIQNGPFLLHQLAH